MTETPRRNGPDGAAEAGIGDLLSRILGDVGSLVRSEVALARAELRAAFRAALAGLVVIGAGLVLVLVALVMLAEAASHGLVAAGLPPGWATLAVAGIAVALGLTGLRYGLYLVTRAARGPERTLRNLRRDAETFGTMVERDA